MKPYYQDEWVTQYHSDALTVLGELESDSIDLLCTDPPYGIGFMGKDWDKALPDKKIWAECLRVLKPGAFGFVMSIPRADCQGRMIISLEDAGFRVDFSPIYWAYASGFPKAQNIGKAVDKRAGRIEQNIKAIKEALKEYFNKSGLTLKQLNGKCGFEASGYLRQSSTWEVVLPSFDKWLVIQRTLFIPNSFDDIFREAEREVIGKKQWNNSAHHFLPGENHTERVQLDETMAATPQAKALDGSYGGFQPKPAVEVIIVCMKPLSEKTFVDQALKNQKGITWLDDCRIPTNGDEINARKDKGNKLLKGKSQVPPTPMNTEWDGKAGRFPANLLVSDDVLNDGRMQKSGIAVNRNRDERIPSIVNYASHNGVDMGYGDSGSFSRYFDLDKWAQKTFPFLIVPKASKSEKNRGCEDFFWLDEERITSESYYKLKAENESLPSKERYRIAWGNIHSTVKPLKLMSYLITLGSRPGDVILDPFGGSGTTALASKLLGRKCITSEIEEKYCEIAAKRCCQSVMELKV